MKTCETCVEFCAKTETCNCPLNAFPDVYSEPYMYARTAAGSAAFTITADSANAPKKYVRKLISV